MDEGLENTDFLLTQGAGCIESSSPDSGAMRE